MSQSLIEGINGRNECVCFLPVLPIPRQGLRLVDHNVKIIAVPGSEPKNETGHIPRFRPGFQPQAHKRLGIQELAEHYIRRVTTLNDDASKVPNTVPIPTYTYPNFKKIRKLQKFPENPVP